MLFRSFNKNLASWLLYDGANSFLTTALGGLFLAQWVILDNHFADIWYGGSFTIATILTLATSPFWGAWSDRIGKRLPFIKWLTFILIFLTFSAAIIAPSSLPIKPRVITVLALAILIQYFYQLSLIFYNVLLEQLSTPKTRGKISGLGDAFGNAGWIFGSALFLPFASKKITLWGEPGRAQVFFPAFVIFTLLALPLLFWFKEKRVSQEQKTTTSFASVYHKTFHGLKELIGKNKNVALFLLAFCFVSDAILTIQLYFAVIMDRLYGISDTKKLSVLVLMFSFVIIGGYILGRVSDTLGTKKILIISCFILAAIFSLAFLVSYSWVLYLLAFFGGIGWGGFYVTARSLLIKISPLAQLGEYFGFYSTFQRFASVIGPILWGVVTLSLKHTGNFQYQAAGFSLIFLMVIGVLLLLRVEEKRIKA
jgi:UMF1 family MFS transporter